jgi:hypothetical protein
MDTPMTYQLTSGDTIVRLSDNAFIPQAPGNRDYAEYLEWLEAGNEPLPAPEPPAPGPDWRGFLAALRDTSVFQELRDQARADVGANALATELRIAMGEAALGLVDVDAIQVLLVELWPSITEAQQNTILALAATHFIPLQAPV